ncbi:MAG: hypothetical protein ABIB79_02255, partial [archaeon]
MKKLVFVLLLVMLVGVVSGAPELLFSSAKAGMNNGWPGDATRGAAISLWGKGLGSSGTITVAGQTLSSSNPNQVAEWGATTNPTTSKGLQRITFWLNNNMALGPTTIRVNVAGENSNTLPFTIDNTGAIYVYPDDAGAQGWSDEEDTFKDMSPGDFLYFKTGIYDWEFYVGYDNNRNFDGTESNRITVTSYPGQEAQVTHSGSLDIEANYWTFSNLHFKGGYIVYGDDDGFCVGDSPQTHLESLGCSYDSTGMNHVMHSYSHYFKFLGNYIYCDTSQTAYDSNAYPVYISSGDYQEIKWNEVHGGSDFVMHFYDEDRCSGAASQGRGMDNCVISNNIFDATPIGTATRYNFRCGLVAEGKDGIADINNLSIYNNIFYSTNEPIGNSGAPGTSGIIRMAEDMDDIYIYNNTFYNGYYGIHFNNEGPNDPDNFVIERNIFYDLDSDEVIWDYSGENVNLDYNVYEGIASLTNVNKGLNDLENTDPQFTDPANGDFTPLLGSPACGYGAIPCAG